MRLVLVLVLAVARPRLAAAREVTCGAGTVLDEATSTCVVAPVAVAPAVHAVPQAPPTVPQAPPTAPPADRPFKRGQPAKALHFMHVTKTGGTSIEAQGLKAGLMFGTNDKETGVGNGASSWHMCYKYAGRVPPACACHAAATCSRCPRVLISVRLPLGVPPARPCMHACGAPSRLDPPRRGDRLPDAARLTQLTRSTRARAALWHAKVSAGVLDQVNALLQECVPKLRLVLRRARAMRTRVQHGALPPPARQVAQTHTAGARQFHHPPDELQVCIPTFPFPSPRCGPVLHCSAACASRRVCEWVPPMWPTACSGSFTWQLGSLEPASSRMCMRRLHRVGPATAS